LNQNLIQRAIEAVMPLVRVSGLLSSLATFQSSDAADFPDGFYSDDDQPISGLMDLPCMASQENTSFISADEQKTVQTVTSTDIFSISFGDIYPSAVDGWREGWRVVIVDALGNSATYDVLGVGADSQGKHTVCRARVVTI
jgi:hypothetical protein